MKISGVYLATLLVCVVMAHVKIADAGSLTCPADTNDDGQVNVMDLNNVILDWGVCPGCAGDTDGNGVVNVMDLNAVILGWGACPVDTWCDRFESVCGFNPNSQYFNDMDDCVSKTAIYTPEQQECADQHLDSAEAYPSAAGFHCSVASFMPVCEFN